jgi:hypothetical protein
MAEAGFEKVPQTNNHVERTDRMLRLLEKVRYKWRQRRMLVRFVVVTLDAIWRDWTPAEVETAQHSKPVGQDTTQVHDGQRSRQVACNFSIIPGTWHGSW